MSHLVNPSLPITVAKDATAVAVIETVDTGDDVQDDYELARQTLRETVTKASKALDGILSVAESSDHPRAFEVAGQLLKVVGDAAKDLLDLQAKRAALTGEAPAASGDTNIENAVFVGTTAELQEILKRNKQGKTYEAE